MAGNDKRPKTCRVCLTRIIPGNLTSLYYLHGGKTEMMSFFGFQIEKDYNALICKKCSKFFERVSDVRNKIRQNKAANFYTGLEDDYQTETEDEMEEPFATLEAEAITIKQESGERMLIEEFPPSIGEDCESEYSLTGRGFQLDLQCDQCSLQFAAKAVLAKHIRSCHKQPSKSRHEQPSKSTQKQPTLSSNSPFPWYACKFGKCKKGFKTRGEWLSHQITHSKERPHKCRLCGQRFKRLPDCKQHEKRETCMEEKLDSNERAF